MSFLSISRFLVAVMKRFGKLLDFQGTLALQKACIQESVGVCVCMECVRVSGSIDFLSQYLQTDFVDCLEVCVK